MRKIAAGLAVAVLLVVGVVGVQASHGPNGDANADGQVTTADAQVALAYVAGLTPLVHPTGDANCDGAVTTADVQAILAHIAGLRAANTCIGFPYGEDVVATEIED